ncbi:family 16 glycosylhydrolase [Methylosinus sp. H3A]|uniref:family 16 glycosylhydrolase n=1 Tax=Methylosinus sp. H3A TaxID=2785786 RepID=UPI0039175909
MRPFRTLGPECFRRYGSIQLPGQTQHAHAEIDLLEFFGHSSSFYTTIYSGGQNDNAGTTVGQHIGLIDGQFHTYGLDWTAQHIDFYLDQQLIYSAPASLVNAYQGVSLTPS